MAQLSPTQTVLSDDLLPPDPVWRLVQRARPFLLLAIAYLIYNCIKFILFRKFAEWDQVFVFAATRLRGGINIYAIAPTLEQRQHPYTYPPFQALLALPFSYLATWLSRLGWFAINAVALIALWKLSWKSSGGAPLNDGRMAKSEALICLLGFICGMRYVQGTFGHQQSDIVIASLLVCGCFTLQCNRDIVCAICWGVAAACKGPPLLLAPYLVWRGRWRAAIIMIVFALGLNLAPDLVHHPEHGIWLSNWYASVIQPKTGEIGDWYVDVTINQSLAGAAHRWFTTIASVDHQNVLAISDRESIISARSLKFCVYATEAILLGLCAWIMGRPFRRLESRERIAAECSLVFILILLLSPMSHKTHFCILIFPGFLVARWAIEKRDKLALVSLIVCLILIGILDRNFFGMGLGDLFAWYGNVMFGAIAIGIACTGMLMQDHAEFRMLSLTAISR